MKNETVRLRKEYRELQRTIPFINHYRKSPSARILVTKTCYYNPCVPGILFLRHPKTKKLAFLTGIRGYKTYNSSITTLGDAWFSNSLKDLRDVVNEKPIKLTTSHELGCAKYWKMPLKRYKFIFRDRLPK